MVISSLSATEKKADVVCLLKWQTGTGLNNVITTLSILEHFRNCAFRGHITSADAHFTDDQTNCNIVSDPAVKLRDNLSR